MGELARESRRTLGNAPGRALLAFGLILVAVAPVATAWVITRTSPALIGELDPVVEAVVMPPLSAVIDLDSAGVLQGTFDEDLRLISTGAQGTVSEVALRPGEPVNTGQIVYRVDAIGVMAYASDTTFYRPLTTGMSGPDVEALQQLLNSPPLSSGLVVSGKFTNSDKKAVRALEKHLGVTAPSGTFVPSMVIRLPVAGFAPVAVGIVQDEPAPALGEVIATQDAIPSRFEVVAPASLPDASYVFATVGRSIDLTLADGVWSFPDLPSIQDLFATGMPEDGFLSFEGRVRLSAPEPAQAVPATAIIGVESGAPCVYVEARDGTFESAPVVIVQADQSGAAILEPSIPPASGVLVNPRAILDNPRCH